MGEKKVKVYVVAAENESKWKKAKCWMKNRWTDISTWCSENKGTIMVVAPVVITGIATTAKVVGKSINLHKEQGLRDKYVYDTSLGHYWELKSKLSNQQWTEINQRRDSGESLGKILDDMKVLK